MSPTAIRKTLAVSAFSLLAFCAAQAGLPENDVYPKPQSVKQTGALFDASKLAASSYARIPAVKSVLAPALKAAKLKAAGTVAVEVETDARKVESVFVRNKIRDVPGAYFLKVGTTKIEIYAKSDDGVFYAAQTLARMIDADGKLGVCEIADWPDVPFRGSVEGFYGRVWSHDARLSQLRFYGKYKMNAYVYAPKDDPFHKTRWREAYPDDEAKKFKELLQVAAENHVHFTWAIHLGESFNPDDRENEYRRMEGKFESMYKLGVRAFAIFFDDFGNADADFHAEACNRAVAWLDAKGDCAPLVLCPHQYNRGWARGNYLDTLGKKLAPSVNVMWTGDAVCCDITADAMRWIADKIGRKAYVWWNWPVVDYCPSALLLGRTYGLAKENKDCYAGFVSNPMDKPEASKIALFGVADYCWNVDAFDSVASWKAGIRQLFPRYADAMQTLADHSSDQGKNGHSFRREESEEFKPVIDAAREEFAAKGKFSAGTKKALLAEFEKMQNASRELVAHVPEDNPELWLEIEFWARTLGETGKFGKAVTEFTVAEPKKRLELASVAAAAFAERERTAQKQMAHAEEIGAPQRSPCAVADRVVMPFLTDVFLEDWSRAASSFLGKKVSPRSAHHEAAAGTSYGAFSDDARLKNLSSSRTATRTVELKRIYENIALASKKHIGIALAEGVPATGISLRLNNVFAAKAGTLEVSADGKKWTKQPARVSDGALVAKVDVAKRIRYVRFVNNSSREVSFRIESFAVEVPADARENAFASIYDGDPMTGYAVVSTETFTPPDGAKARTAFVLSDAPAGAHAVSVGDGKVTVKGTPKAPITVFEILWK